MGDGCSFALSLAWPLRRPGRPLGGPGDRGAGARARRFADRTAVGVQRGLERETGLEPATPTLARLCSTTELFPPTGCKGYARVRGLSSRVTWHGEGATGLLGRPQGVYGKASRTRV